jgi:hypothetical protein
MRRDRNEAFGSSTAVVFLTRNKSLISVAVMAAERIYLTATYLFFCAVFVIIVGPFPAATAAVWLLVFAGRVYTRRASHRIDPEELRTRPGFRYNLCVMGVRYLIPVGVALTFYVLLSWYVVLFADSVSIDWLIGMERTFEQVSGFFAEHLKLTEVGVMVVLVLVYVLSCVLLTRWRRRRARAVSLVHRVVDTYCTYSGPLATGLATLAALSLFGMQLGTPTDDLRARIKIAQEGYADVAEQVEAKLTDRVAIQLYAKVWNGFPRHYRDAMVNLSTRDVLVEQLSHNNQAAHGVPDFDRTLQTELANRTRVATLGPRLHVMGSAPPVSAGNLQPDQVNAASTALDSLPHEEGVDLLNDGQRKIVLQVEKLVSERILLLTKPVTDAIPILEPVVQTFAEAIDKTLQDRLARAYDRVMTAATREPARLPAIIGKEAGDIVATVDVAPLVERATPRATELATQFDQVLGTLRAGQAQVEAHRTVPPSFPPGLPRLPLPHLPQFPYLPQTPFEPGSRLPDLDLDLPRVPQAPDVPKVPRIPRIR